MIQFMLHNWRVILTCSFAMFVSMPLAAAGMKDAKPEECPPTRQSSEQSEAVSDLVRRNQDIVLGTVVEQRPVSMGEWRGANRKFRVVIDSVLKGNMFPEQIVFEIVGLQSDSLYPIDPYVLGVHSKHASVAVKYPPPLTQDNAEYPPFGATRKFKLTSAKGQNSCDYAPMLEVGMTYLMFLSRPYSHLSFEPIVNEADDAWLAHVQKVVAKDAGKH